VTFRPVGTGWACDTHLLDDAWIVQLPRTERAAEKLRTQMLLLPELAREVSAPIPLPELVSYQPAAMAYRRIEGDPCEGTEGIWPERLGRFLYDLHAVPPEFVGLRARGADDVRVEVRAEASRLRALVDQLLSVDERSRADRAMARYLDDDDLWRFAPCLTHGDLGPEHVLVTGSGDLAGVIDWEEASVGDPAWDFAWWLHERGLRRRVPASRARRVRVDAVARGRLRTHRRAGRIRRHRSGGCPTATRVDSRELGVCAVTERRRPCIPR
jgi:aminoglycoside phosphotransferase (APT) family kinase protein